MSHWTLLGAVYRQENFCHHHEIKDLRKAIFALIKQSQTMTALFFRAATGDEDVSKPLQETVNMTDVHPPLDTASAILETVT